MKKVVSGWRRFQAMEMVLRRDGLVAMNELVISCSAVNGMSFVVRSGCDETLLCWKGTNPVLKQLI